MIGTEWDICSITPEEVDHMDDFIVPQISFVGEAQISQNYAIKNGDIIIAGIRTCFYLGRCLGPIQH